MVKFNSIIALLLSLSVSMACAMELDRGIGNILNVAGKSDAFFIKEHPGNGSYFKLFNLDRKSGIELASATASGNVFPYVNHVSNEIIDLYANNKEKFAEIFGVRTPEEANHYSIDSFSKSISRQKKYLEHVKNYDIPLVCKQNVGFGVDEQLTSGLIDAIADSTNTNIFVFILNADGFLQEHHIHTKFTHKQSINILYRNRLFYLLEKACRANLTNTDSNAAKIVDETLTIDEHIEKKEEKNKEDWASKVDRYRKKNPDYFLTAKPNPPSKSAGFDELFNRDYKKQRESDFLAPQINDSVSQYIPLSRAFSTQAISNGSLKSHLKKGARLEQASDLRIKHKKNKVNIVLNDNGKKREFNTSYESLCSLFSEDEQILLNKLRHYIETAYQEAGIPGKINSCVGQTIALAIMTNIDSLATISLPTTISELISKIPDTIKSGTNVAKQLQTQLCSIEKEIRGILSAKLIGGLQESDTESEDLGSEDGAYATLLSFSGRENIIKPLLEEENKKRKVDDDDNDEDSDLITKKIKLTHNNAFRVDNDSENLAQLKKYLLQSDTRLQDTEIVAQENKESRNTKGKKVYAKEYNGSPTFSITLGDKEFEIDYQELLGFVPNDIKALIEETGEAISRTYCEKSNVKEYATQGFKNSLLIYAIKNDFDEQLSKSLTKMIEDINTDLKSNPPKTSYERQSLRGKYKSRQQYISSKYFEPCQTKKTTSKFAELKDHNKVESMVVEEKLPSQTIQQTKTAEPKEQSQEQPACGQYPDYWTWVGPMTPYYYYYYYGQQSAEQMPSSQNNNNNNNSNK